MTKRFFERQRAKSTRRSQRGLRVETLELRTMLTASPCSIGADVDQMEADTAALTADFDTVAQVAKADQQLVTAAARTDVDGDGDVDFDDIAAFRSHFPDDVQTAVQLRQTNIRATTAQLVDAIFTKVGEPAFDAKG